MDLKRRDVLLGSTGIAGGWAASGLAASVPAGAQAQQSPGEWDRETDIVVIGAGATGLPASIVAQEAGFSVTLVEAEKDIGGHAITSGGNVPLGGGTSVQKKYGIDDSPDLLFRDRGAIRRPIFRRPTRKTNCATPFGSIYVCGPIRRR